MSGHVFEHTAGRSSRGSVILVHGSAPFNRDGRVPLVASSSPYARTSFYRDLSDGLRLEGWSVLRYDKPGVQADGVDVAEYATTDLAVLGRQLRALWKLLPVERPRIVFAWSEGTLHVRLLPVEEIDAVVLLGAIATNIGDVISAQGGPPSEELRESLERKDRREMLGVDRPTGRLIDELALDANWKTLAGGCHAPVLVLHGTDDREVPVSQAGIWEDVLPGDRVTVLLGTGRDHRWMSEGVYEPWVVAKEVADWLDGLFPTH